MHDDTKRKLWGFFNSFRVLVCNSTVPSEANRYWGLNHWRIWGHAPRKCCVSQTSKENFPCSLRGTFVKVVMFLHLQIQGLVMHFITFTTPSPVFKTTFALYAITSIMIIFRKIRHLAWRFRIRDIREFKRYTLYVRRQTVSGIIMVSGNKE